MTQKNGLPIDTHSHIVPASLVEQAGRGGHLLAIHYQISGVILEVRLDGSGLSTLSEEG